MEDILKRPPGSESYSDDELIDTLIAVSVVAKRLAERLRKEKSPPAQNTSHWMRNACCARRGQGKSEELRNE